MSMRAHTAPTLPPSTATIFRDLRVSESSVGAVCVVIPCVPKHLEHLPGLLATIAEQTLPAAHIVVALSETGDEECGRTVASLRALVSTPLTLTCVSAPAYAGQNRNRGGELCASEFISFIDADDLMMPERLAVMTELLERTRADAGFHAWDPSSCCEGRELSAAAMREMHERQKREYGPIHFEAPFRVHHGHPTVRLATFAHAKQNESERWRRAQDCEYARRLVGSGFAVVATDRRAAVAAAATWTQLSRLITAAFPRRRQAARHLPPRAVCEGARARPA